MSGRVKTERTSGNVFADLGFPKVEAENLMLRSESMSETREIARGMTQANALVNPRGRWIGIARANDGLQWN